MNPKDLQESFSFTKAARRGSVNPPFPPDLIKNLASEGIHFGTSSWRYRGWEGTIYGGGYESEGEFQRECLKEYSQLLGCVGLEATYFSWPTPEGMNVLSESTPPGFIFCPKVSKQITTPGNPSYLNAAHFTEKFLKPLESLRPKLGLIHFEWSGEEAQAWEKFFAAVPRDYSYAVELKNSASATVENFAKLRAWQVSPAFSFSASGMKEQFAAYLESGGGQDSSPILLLAGPRPGQTAEEAVRLYSPYKEIRDVYNPGRVDICDLALWAIERKRKIFALIHNHFEGSAPHTIAGLVERVLATRKV